MFTWNYRIMVDEEGTFKICEVFYDNGEISGYSDTDGPLGENLEEIQSDFNMMRHAFDKPVLIETELEIVHQTDVEPEEEEQEQENGE